MRLILVFIFAFSIYPVVAQDTTFTDRQAYLDFLYGHIPEQQTRTGFLLDRVPFIEKGDERFEIHESVATDTLDVNAWIAYYKFLDFGSTRTNDIPPIDSLTWPVFDQLLLNQSSAELRLPLMVMDFDMNRIKGDSTETKRLGVTAILADTVYNDGLIVYQDTKYHLTNRDNEILYSVLEVNGTSRVLRTEGEADIGKDLMPGINVMTATHFFENGDSVVHYFKLFKEVRSELRTASIFDETGSISGDDLKLEYGIRFGSGNTKLTKPVYFVSGFGPAAAMKFLNDLLKTSVDDLYDRYNLGGLMNELHVSGHDIVVVKFDPAIANIQNDGELFIELINELNGRKFANGSFIENVIIGYSAGALVTKYALDKMEFEHLRSGKPHHHTRLYISFEGEHLGAHVPLGAQHATEHMKVNNGCLSTNIMHYLGNSAMARQLLMYFHTQTGGHTYLPYSDGQGAHIDRFYLQYAMENSYSHAKQWEKYGYTGYPAFSRNVAIADGSRVTDTYKEFLAPDQYPLAVHAFIPVFYQKNFRREWTVNWDFNSNFNSSGSSEPRVVFRYKEGRGDEPKYLEEFRTDTDILVIDMTAGGFSFGDEDLQLRVFNKMAGFCFDGCLFGSPDIYEYRVNCFTPVFSCLGIRDKSLYVKNHYADIDLHELDLMRVSFGSSSQGDFGYPVLGHPEDHFEITPFEAIYCNAYNEMHITSKRVSGNAEEVDDLALESVAISGEAIKDFIMSEIQPEVLYLQNRRIGWNTTPDQVYRADFAAERIEIGERVWPGTDVAPFEVLGNGVVELEAVESVHIVEGFHAHSGSVVHASIE